MTSTWIVDTARTPIGRHRGALSSVRPDDMAAAAVRAVVDRGGVEPERIDDVYLGCANGAGEDNRNVARMSALLAGLGHRVPGATVNRLCGSGLEAVACAARAIACGEGDLVVAGGVESMSRSPWVMMKPEKGLHWGDSELVDTTIGWRLVNPRMPLVAATDSMGQTAENVARKYDVSREDQDRFAFGSHQHALAAQLAGRLAEEIVPVEVEGSAAAALVASDECPRSDTTLERLARLRPAFASDGTVTAGNSSPINDGAAALLLVGEPALSRLGRPPLARLVGSAVVGVDPALMGLGPIPATRLVLNRVGLRIDDLSVVELNEAFASQALVCVRELRLDPEIVNPNGGAIALGHPLGCSGARILGALARELRRRGGRYGLAAMCIGVGQGIAMVIENPEAR